MINDDDVLALRNAVAHLADSGYCEVRVLERLELSDISGLLWRALPIYREEQLSVRDVLTSAIDLFLLQGAIPPTEFDRLFNKTDQDALIRTGVLFIDDKGFALARVSLFPVGNLLIFSDHAWCKLPHPGCAEVPYDQVMSVGADSRWLERITLRRRVGSALDLCTGSGIHALLAARHSQRVVAVDISQRAARCTRFNVQVSGAANVEIALGDLFEPVDGERFDLITANPPFVPSPLNSLGFRDGGRSGEDVQQRIVTGLPHHLTQGGIAQIVTELGERDDNLISDRLRRWLGDAPMDILILRLREHSAANYAIGHAQGDYDFGEFLDSVHDWAGNLRAQGYSRIVSVLLVFQWSDPESGPPWTRSEEAPPPLRYAGIEVEKLFNAERITRKADFHEILERSKLLRAGQIGLIESRVLGTALQANAQAQLLGTALPIIQWLDPLEKTILELIETPLKYLELLALSGDLNLDEKTVFTAVSLLIRRGLVVLISDQDCN